MTQVKLFVAYGDEGMNRIEDEINKWLAKNPNCQIVNTQTEFAQNEPGEDYPGPITLVVLIWYKT